MAYSFHVTDADRPSRCAVAVERDRIRSEGEPISERVEVREVLEDQQVIAQRVVGCEPVRFVLGGIFRRRRIGVEVADCGDVPVFPMDLETTAESIAAHVATVAAQGTTPVLVGGDHYCTFPAFRGFAEGSDREMIGLVQMDADTASESPLFGEHFYDSPTHHISESPYTDFDHVAQVGIRGYEAPEFFEFADETGLGLYTIRDVEQRGVRAVVRDAVEHAAAETDAVYVTFDIDSVDPSVALGTGTPEPGGLSAS